ncbi:MAG TPA: hypothetical protein PK205_07175 [Promineifilum sp.]|nr:hypothetical protein [Promineifilum sp.]
MFVNSAVQICGHSQMVVGAAAQTPPLSAGVYDVWHSADTYIKVHETLASDVTDETGYLVPAGNIVSVRISKDGWRLGASAGCSVHKVG